MITRGAVFALFLGAVSAQNCPILAPAYPPLTELNTATSADLKAVAAKFEKALLCDPRINLTTTFFATEIYSPMSNKAFFTHYNTPPLNQSTLDVGPDTLFRIFSISKAVAVYATLAKIGDKYWDEPITKFIPELPSSPPDDTIRRPNWSEITLGALVDHLSGISREYALTDASTQYPQVDGLRKLNDSQIVRCGSSPWPACTREESFHYMLQPYPLTMPFRTPNYNNAAFQLLGYAVENITGMPFPDIVTETLVTPLNLSRTFLTKPPASESTNAVILEPLWSLDMGDEAPAAGYYQSVTDLTTLGRSILNSTFLPPATTRQWLKPITHTSSLYTSIGRPWEILRTPVESPLGSNKTRIVDIYTKFGGGDGYTSLIGLSPDHDFGISILTAGPVSSAATRAIQDLFQKIWIPEVEEISRQRALENFVGTYTFAGENTTAEITLLEGEPALFMPTLISNGTDIMTLAVAVRNPSFSGPVPKMWFYPTGLVEGNRMSFRAVRGVPGVPVEVDCGTWAEIDRFRFGNTPLDLVIFELGEDGKAVKMEVPIIGKTLVRE
ncbi:beta-lactamase/transpeptidase-like protein [Podospora australis]|uniref:Beta-lactamase/transpeptidase-like protein n=1 Tax=Podospora australis TaxID=1536484 RepID=A0AAN7ABT8_9PEZI|nr:beta-lactamase/transpeptidase-like protein [Podospora australis]